ncbi:MAG: hypothetical protein H0W90_13650 [Actinobacteria bacterium]|nr:hypothetical protein [Actinomycetota bacterium]
MAVVAVAEVSVISLAVVCLVFGVVKVLDGFALIVRVMRIERTGSGMAHAVRVAAKPPRASRLK